MKKGFDPAHLDVRRFAEESAELGMESPLSAFPRLLQETVPCEIEPMVDWTVRGELLNPGHVRPDVWLHLEAGAALQLTCQRCLLPVEVHVSVDRSFRFVPDEASAATEDEDSEEDVLAETTSLDLPGLLEDELLMELPIAPRHDSCPVSLPVSAGEEEFEAALAARENPFDVLSGLKRSKRH